MNGEWRMANGESEDERRTERGPTSPPPRWPLSLPWQLAGAGTAPRTEGGGDLGHYGSCQTCSAEWRTRPSPVRCRITCPCLCRGARGGGGRGGLSTCHCSDACNACFIYSFILCGGNAIRELINNRGGGSCDWVWV